MRIIHIGFFLLLYTITLGQDRLPEGFVYLEEAIPTAIIDLRYCYEDNFVGRPIEGYVEPKCIISKKAAIALKKVQTALQKKDLSLKIFDAYRPQRAVDQFRSWARDWNDTLMKAKYYPKEPKPTLFRKGYIATRSGHSRGSTLDLTIVDKDGHELDMGTPWDYFGKESRPLSFLVTAQQRENRLLLRNVMIQHGFQPLGTEWWHFTLKNEPFPKTYFDFLVR